MLLAFAWWSYLLFIKNSDAFLAKMELAKIAMIAEGRISNDAEFRETEIYQELSSKYKRQEWMIFGEAIVFIVSLVIGVWLINRGYNQEMEVAQQRRNFLLSITHELKSPIASIKAVLQTFQKRQLDKNQVDKLSSNAINDANRLHKLVDNLLMAAKVETAYQLSKESIDFVAIAEELLEDFQIKYPDLNTRFQAEKNIPSIQADKLGMTTVLHNVLENAVKYAGQSAAITLSISRKGNKLNIHVADNGMGISDKEKQKVFNRFYRVGNEDTRRTKGTGLGLYIVQQVVEAHQGKIKLLDNVPQGAIFAIELPI